MMVESLLDRLPKILLAMLATETLFSAVLEGETGEVSSLTIDMLLADGGSIALCLSALLPLLNLFKKDLLRSERVRGMEAGFLEAFVSK